jgi:RNA polymerase sigma-70 factor (ECF subfamily)
MTGGMSNKRLFVQIRHTLWSWRTSWGKRPRSRHPWFSLVQAAHTRRFLVPTLLQQISAGDQSAVARCLDEYGGMVWSLASRYLGGCDRSEIEDAVQEVFVSIWVSAGRYDPQRGTEPAFVATIAHRRLNEHRRRAVMRLRRRADLSDAHAGTKLAHAAHPSAQDLAQLGTAFENLPEEERTALWMAVNKGLSHSEIAAGTDAPIGTVKSRLRRAVVRLQRAMGVDAPADPKPGANPGNNKPDARVGGVA